MRKFLSLFLALAMSIACCTLAAAEDTAEAMQYTEENITIDAGDHQIPATLTVPVGAVEENPADPLRKIPGRWRPMYR